MQISLVGGNGLDCEVEFVDETRMRYKTFIAGEDGALGMADPNNPAVYLESRMHRTLESEASVLSVVCTDAGIMTSAPYRVIDASHWVYAGTGLRNGDVFGRNGLQERGAAASRALRPTR